MAYVKHGGLFGWGLQWLSVFKW